MSTRLVNLQRLGQMPLTEIAGRTRQEASKWWDRLATTGPRPARGSSEAEWRPGVDAFRKGAARRFFAGAMDASTPRLLADRMPEAVRHLIASAERIREGHFDLLGYRDLPFGHPPDWHLDPVSGRRAPRVHWSRLDLLDRSAVGDSKVVWELNRHQWLVRLGQAYRLTGDERYSECFADAVRDWTRSNPLGVGINWASSLEAALRLISWCWALVLFRDSPALTRDLASEMIAGIWDHASHVDRYLSHYFSPNTHLTGEALGLVYAGTLFPEWGRARRWQHRGLRILADQSARQIHGDGVHFEQSACYQRYTFEIYLHLLLLGARNGFDVPPSVLACVRRLLDFLLAIRRPDGAIPQIGDSDGGWLLPLADRAPDDYRGVFSTAAALFGRPDYAWAADGLAPETLWLLGTEGAAAFGALRPGPPAQGSQLFPQGGYAVMRSGWTRDGHHLIFDVGPLGGLPSAGHGHADLLSIQCSAFGEPFLVDAGTGSYAETPWRDFFRSTASHSTVMVDGVSQATPAGAFAWRERPRAHLRRWLSTEAFDFADAEHDGYLRLPDPVRHRRRVLFVKPRFWVLVDDLEGRERHQVDLRFQFGPVPVELGPGPWARATAEGGALLVCPMAVAPLEARLVEGRQQPLEGWWSPDYGQRRPAPTLVYSVVHRLPLRIFTLLLPSADPAALPPILLPRMSGSGVLVGIAFGTERERVELADPDGVLVHRRGAAAR